MINTAGLSVETTKEPKRKASGGETGRQATESYSSGISLRDLHECGHTAHWSGGVWHVCVRFSLLCVVDCRTGTIHITTSHA